MNLQVRVSSMRTCAHSSAEVIKFPGPRALSVAAAAGTVQQSGAEMALFLYFLFYSAHFLHTDESYSTLHHPKHPHPHPHISTRRKPSTPPSLHSYNPRTITH